LNGAEIERVIPHCGFHRPAFILFRKNSFTMLRLSRKAAAAELKPMVNRLFIV
jgi:hypothetical protein